MANILLGPPHTSSSSIPAPPSWPYIPIAPAVAALVVLPLPLGTSPLTRPQVATPPPLPLVPWIGCLYLGSGFSSLCGTTPGVEFIILATMSLPYSSDSFLPPFGVGAFHLLYFSSAIPLRFLPVLLHPALPPTPPVGSFTYLLPLSY